MLRQEHLAEEVEVVLLVVMGPQARHFHLPLPTMNCHPDPKNKQKDYSIFDQQVSRFQFFVAGTGWGGGGDRRAYIILPKFPNSGKHILFLQ